MADEVPIKEYIDSLWLGHHREHEALQRSLDLARDQMRDKLMEMNQFRAQIDQERGRYITRENYDLRHDELSKRVNAFEQYRANLEGRLWMLGAGLTTAGVLINVAFHYWGK